MRGPGPQQAPCRALGLWAAVSQPWHFPPVVSPRCFQNRPLQVEGESSLMSHSFLLLSRPTGYHHLPGHSGCPPGAGRADSGPEDHPA